MATAEDRPAWSWTGGASDSRAAPREQLAHAEDEMCQRQPACPDAEAPDGSAAHVAASHPEQGWSLLCNGVVLFDDAGELRPDGRAVAPPSASAMPAAA
jgi:hypothetical protein